MKAIKIPVLLTSSVIAHDTGVALTDTDERIRLGLESVEQWLKMVPATNIVLCDGSNFDFARIVADRFPLAEIECLHFENNQELVKKFGRGYGEGEIVRYALDHSKYIAKAGCFAKCSSKLWVENFAQCLSAWNGSLLCKGVFLNVFSLFKKTELVYIDTRFYIASCTTYKRYFENVHFQINQAKGHGLEECFRDTFLKNNLQKSLFSHPPVICGVGGGTGTYYKNSLKRKLKEKIRQKLVCMDKKFMHFFPER
jgi:hypothetical protein